MSIRDRNIRQYQAISEEYWTFTSHPGTAITTTQLAASGAVMGKNVKITRIGVRATTVSGTTPTLSLVVKDATAVTTLGTTANVTASAGFTELKIAPEVLVPSGDVITADLVIGGTTPSYTNVTWWIVYRTGGPDITNLGLVQ
jgi:hypothetical protein